HGDHHRRVRRAKAAVGRHGIHQPGPFACSTGRAGRRDRARARADGRLMDRWVILDVGETLIDESRIWTIWADVLGIPRLTFMAVLGAAIQRGGQYGRIFDEFGIDEASWRPRVPEVEERYGGFQEQDLYPDARRAVDGLKGLGYRVGLVANQPASRTAELRALGFEVEVIAMSDEMGVHKPDPAFFTRMLEMAGNPEPAQLAYAGDRVDNDVIPA